MKVTGIIVIGTLETIPKEIRRLRNQRTSRNHPDNSLINIGQNTEKSPGDSRRLVVTLTSVILKNSQNSKVIISFIFPLKYFHHSSYMSQDLEKAGFFSSQFGHLWLGVLTKSFTYLTYFAVLLVVAISRIFKAPPLCWEVLLHPFKVISSFYFLGYFGFVES